MTEQLNTETAPPARRATLLDLSVTQLIAGSLAAATAAALGSRLGVLGTISGAAIGSVVSAIAASIYTTSMTRAREALRWQKLHSRQAQLNAQNVQNASASASTSSSVQNAPDRTPRRILATAAVVFALAVAFLPGLQLASGADVTGTSLGTRPSADQLEPRGEPRPATTESAVTPETIGPTSPEASTPATTDA
ncbi:MAG TPA: hypothetical protein VFG98_12820, partial [Intrasporangium sp.]|nr:hypothetical protein [Intrasporangium sp.]